jgi:hypothetical protein
MADATRAAFTYVNVAPFIAMGTTDFAMIEILFIYQLAHKPVQAVARRWWCRSLFRASRGKRRCPECPGSYTKPSR